MKISRTVKTSKAIKLQARDGKKIIGRAFLYLIENDLHKQPYGLMEDVFVEEEYRKQGIGSQLVKGAIAEARERGCYKLIGNSRTFKTGVHAFYERLGFKKFGFEFRMDL